MEDGFDVDWLTPRDRFYISMLSLFQWMQHLLEALTQCAYWYHIGSSLP